MQTPLKCSERAQIDSRLAINALAGSVGSCGILAAAPLGASERANRYGRVVGLDDEELTDPHELERLVAWQTWGPILALRPQAPTSRITFARDGSGAIDWEAVGSVAHRKPAPSQRDAGRALREARRLLGSKALLRVRVAGRVEVPRLPESPEAYAEYDGEPLLMKCVRYGLVPQSVLPEEKRRRFRQSCRAELLGAAD